jgi:hypothetical protein
MLADTAVHDVLGAVSMSLMWCGISDSFSLCSDVLVSQDEEDEGDEAFKSEYKEEVMESPEFPSGSEKMRMTQDGLEVSLSVSEEASGRNYLGESRRISQNNEVSPFCLRLCVWYYCYVLSLLTSLSCSTKLIDPSSQIIRSGEATRCSDAEPSSGGKVRACETRHLPITTVPRWNNIIMNINIHPPILVI